MLQAAGKADVAPVALRDEDKINKIELIRLNEYF